MVVIVTSRPVPRASVNGKFAKPHFLQTCVSDAPSTSAYAWCGQYDQYSRCTVGFINWLPNVIGINTASEASTVRADYHTATHELMREYQLHLIAHTLQGYFDTLPYVQTCLGACNQAIYSLTMRAIPACQRFTRCSRHHQTIPNGQPTSQQNGYVSPCL